MILNWHELVPFLIRSAPLLASALKTSGSAFITNILANTFEANPYNVKDIVDKISKDPDSESKLSSLEEKHADTIKSFFVDSSLTESIIKNLLFDRTPNKIEFHISIGYDKEISNVQN